MVRTVAMLAAAVLVSLAPAAAAQDDWSAFAGAAGTYEGKAFSGDGLVPVTTRFTVGPGGRVEGSYAFTQGGTDYDGSLREARIVGARTLVFIWHDAWGYGTLEVVFAQDFGSFTGGWAELEDSSGVHPWVGRRVP